METLAARETYRDETGIERDPIYASRMLWRAHTFRHLVHLLPGQSVLEFGCGAGVLTRQLSQVSRGENPITAVTFLPEPPPGPVAGTDVRKLTLDAIPGTLRGREFDFIVTSDLLGPRHGKRLLEHLHRLLKPGGAIVAFESNPRNPALHVRRWLSARGRRDPRELSDRRALCRLLSEAGFVNVTAHYSDFVLAPLAGMAVRLLRNFSILLENSPGIRTLAGSIVLHAQKPPAERPAAQPSLCRHGSLRKAVSVVIPCHNEEMNIGPLIDGLMRFYGDYLREIIPVEDNSQDDTAEVIRRIADGNALVKPVFRSPPGGVGRALADGYRAARGEYILSMDCDFCHILPEMRDLFDAAAEGIEVVVGSRFSRHSVLLDYPFEKIVANRAFHILANVLLRRRFRDLTNNLKLIRREVANRLDLTQPGFAANAETGLQPLLMGCSMAEVPVSWINRTPEMGVSSFRLMRVGCGYWSVLVRLWWKTAICGRKPVH